MSPSKLLFFTMAIITTTGLAQINDTATLENFISGVAQKELQGLAYGQDFGNYIRNQYTNITLETGKCISKYGKEWRYNPENGQCFSCTEENMESSPLRTAICQDTLMIKGILREMERLAKENNELKAEVEYMGLIQIILVGFTVVYGALFFGIFGILFYLRKYRFNPTTQNSHDVAGNGVQPTATNGATHGDVSSTTRFLD